MKNIHIKTLCGIALIGLVLTSCSDILDEKSRDSFTPDYFKTENGVKGGITSLYSNLRYMWGNGYFLDAMETGTDEYTYGHGADQNFLVLDFTNAGELNPTTCRADVLWGNVYSDINTANGIIENANSVGIDASLVAEANFFRAFDYFELVQTFGGVPLDLGAGELKFNTSATRVSVRNTVPEVYTKCIFPDLLEAVNNLPETGRVTGGLTKTAARLFLSKAYLTYAWWLQNPNNVATYPTCDRTDPDGHDAAWYFQQAYNIAVAGIQNPGKFSLQKSFYDVNVGSNDRNSEIVLYADHAEDDYYGGVTSQDWANGAAPGNFARWMVRWDYTFLQSSTTSYTSNGTGYALARTVQREAVQGKDRPWKEMAPPQEVSLDIFADKVNDSRYDGTFVTQFRGNWDKVDALKATTTMYNANSLPIVAGDSVLTFLDEVNDNVVYPKDDAGNVIAGYSNVGAGTLPGRADWVIDQKGISRYAFLNLWKNGIVRSDNGTGLGKPNGDSPRPYPIAKFSELYLIAAEAAVKGATTQGGYSARELVNVLRARAGVWTYDNNRNRVKVADHSAAMTAATPATITIDYILDERAREFFGEGLRWWDLVRTQTWFDRAATYTICGKGAKGVGDDKAVTYKRTFDTHYWLRPIPSGQIDALQMTDEEKAAYQNPGY